MKRQIQKSNLPWLCHANLCEHWRASLEYPKRRAEKGAALKNSAVLIQVNVDTMIDTLTIPQGKWALRCIEQHPQI